MSDFHAGEFRKKRSSQEEVGNLFPGDEADTERAAGESNLQ